MCPMPARVLRAALYARVSTDDDRQDPRNQLRPLEDFAGGKGWRVEFIEGDRASAGDLRNRSGWRRLLEAARLGQFDLLVVWSLDRAFRSSLEALRTLELLHHEGVGFISMTQPIDTTSPAGRLLFAVLAAVAEIEREMIRERTRAGMARARKEGKQIGRPPGRRDSYRRLRSVQRREPAG
jgi:DNA invertase Pin-like site-specific DNA recombinase